MQLNCAQFCKIGFVKDESEKERESETILFISQLQCYYYNCEELLLLNEMKK